MFIRSSCAGSACVRVCAFVLMLFVLPICTIDAARAQNRETLDPAHCTKNVVPYDIIYVRAPRYGNDQDTIWPEVTRPLNADPGSQLRLLHPDCTEELLFPRPEHQAFVDAPIGNGVVLDPMIAFNKTWVVFAYIHDQKSLNTQRNLSTKGADIYRMHLFTRQVVRLTRQQLTPNTGNGVQISNCGGSPQGSNCPNVGVFNVGPAFVATTNLARPSIVFTSSRNDFLPPRQTGGQQRALQLFTMDWDGHNVRQIGYLNQSMALHPFQLLDGRLVFSSWENQGIRDIRQFNLWTIDPDGRNWNTLSGFGENAVVHHFTTQMPNQDIVTVRYYNQNNNGFGDLTRFPINFAAPHFRPINDPGTYMPFQRPGQIDLTNWTDSFGSLADDFPAPCSVGANIYIDISTRCNPATRVGKVTHPAAAPDGGPLLVYTPAAANSNHIYTSNGTNRPFYDGGLYFMSSAHAVAGTAKPRDFVKILNDPRYSEQSPKPVVRFSELFNGAIQPQVIAPTNNPQDLVANTAFGVVGSASLIWRDTAPRLAGFNRNADDSVDSDPFNASHDALYAWQHQGSDAGLYRDSDIYAVRILAMQPKTDKSYPDNGVGFFNHGDERLRILGEIPVRHEGVIDGKGNVDTSFLAKIPADVPFTFQTLDRNGMVLNMAQTWHQVRPGETRTNCGGCHAHSKTPMEFSRSLASRGGVAPTDLTGPAPLLKIDRLNGSPTTQPRAERAVTVEYQRDIRSILNARCSSCHTDDATHGKLNLFADASTVRCGQTTYPGTYYRLAADQYNSDCPKYGLGPPPGTPGGASFVYPQASRYMRPYQSRQSLLIWKAFGARLDGRNNDTRTTDIDYSPAADTVHANLPQTKGLTWDEKLTLARWIDLGAPVELRSFWGWHEDDLRPTLWAQPIVTTPLRLTGVKIAAYDLQSGLAENSLVVSLNVASGSVPAGTNIASGTTLVNGGSTTVNLPASIDYSINPVVLTVSVRDKAGHVTSYTATLRR